ncbi:MAG: NADH-quinone oxidoreductase subunit L [Anaerolineales bacterium]|nr:NADH-quinone oxidoreductase subunit L [Anaerolineales bacterium]MCB8992117.1 NADH-quinone oxidoreductase subunit L [Ardenticatenaceae bacterium]
MSEQTLQTMTWLIPVGPLLTFFLIVLFTKHNRTFSWLLAWASVIASLVLSWTVALNVLGEGAHHLEENPVVVHSAIDWLPIGDFNAGTWLKMGVAVDPLTAVMLLMVSFAIVAIFVYSVGYHNYGKPRGHHFGEPNHGQEDPLIARFFALMSLFAGAMLLLVVSDNLLQLFVGWEIMGFCSYSLIGFWYARDYHLDEDAIPHITPRAAAVKAFMTTRVADVVMLVGIAYFYRTFGTLNFAEALSAHSLETAVHLIGAGIPGLGLIALLLFTGTVGKSAQWPLHVWLPDAMEGPTPVSATIHAAAMVSAGVFMIVRIFPLIAVGMGPQGSSTVGWVIAGIGAFTALMSATIAVAQYDVKGVLAYSTISQLGFMVAAIGTGAYVAAAFHLVTHGFFKALLFLASGSVIHGMEHGAQHVHDHHTDPQDMRYMGGLRKKMPRTFWTFLIGGMALSGLPFITAGFWSKDEIFADAWYQWSHDGKVLALFVFVMLALAAFLTAFYTMRQISMTFLGKPRTPLAEHAHESDNFMTIPLMGLSIFALAAGWFGIPDNFLGLDLGKINQVHHLVGSTIFKTMEELHELHLVEHALETLPWNWVPLGASLLVALGGLFVGWWIYGRKPLVKDQQDPLVAPLGPLHVFLNHKWYWDELYQIIFIRPINYFSEVIVYEVMDKGIIDGILHLVARIFYTIGYYMKRTEELVWGDGVDWVKDQFLAIVKEFRQLQTGKIQEYAVVSMLIASALALVVLAINYGWLTPLF